MSLSRTEVPLTLDAILRRISEAEKHYQELEKLEFRKPGEAIKVKLKKDNNNETFVRKFFDKFNFEYKTYYSVSENIYCDIDTRRSIGDIYRAAYSYLGNKITLKEVIIHTYNRVLRNEICSNYCYRINKRVYKERGENKNGQYYDPSYYDELGFTKQHYQLLIDNTK